MCLRYSQQPTAFEPNRNGRNQHAVSVSFHLKGLWTAQRFPKWSSSDHSWVTLQRIQCTIAFSSVSFLTRIHGLQLMPANASLFFAQKVLQLSWSEVRRLDFDACAHPNEATLECILFSTLRSFLKPWNYKTNINIYEVYEKRSKWRVINQAKRSDHSVAIEHRSEAASHWPGRDAASQKQTAVGMVNRTGWSKARFLLSL